MIADITAEGNAAIAEMVEESDESPTRGKQRQQQLKQGGKETFGKPGDQPPSKLTPHESNPVSSSLFSWLKCMKLHQFRPTRLRSDLANGCLIAEVLARFFPAQVSMHSFDRAISAAAKKDNWKQVRLPFSSSSSSSLSSWHNLIISAILLY